MWHWLDGGQMSRDNLRRFVFCHECLLWGHCSKVLWNLAYYDIVLLQHFWEHRNCLAHEFFPNFTLTKANLPLHAFASSLFFFLVVSFTANPATSISWLWVSSWLKPSYVILDRATRTATTNNMLHSEHFTPLSLLANSRNVRSTFFSLHDSSPPFSEWAIILVQAFYSVLLWHWGNFPN